MNRMNTRLLYLLIFLPFFSFSQLHTPQEIERYKAEAQQVTIIRDNWGVPHIYGKTDAHAVFGLLYAQCEENFNKVEENNLEMMGRLSEVYGESRLYDDLEMQMIYDTAAAKKDYSNSPAWLRKLLDAAADGVNYYLYTHPETKPAVLTHFEPWFALLRTNGSISATQDGGISVSDMKALYPAKDNGVAFREKENPYISHDPMGSNGFAVAPSKTASKNAILYINPACYLLLPVGSTDGKRRRLECLWRCNVGNLFCIPGFQSLLWLDAYIWCGRCSGFIYRKNN